MAHETDSSGSTGGTRAHFDATLWTVVLTARDGGAAEAQEALAKLCEIYWYPLYAFIRRRGRSPHDAEDLTQGFFAHLLQNNGLASVEPGRGKFRTFLLTCLRHYMENKRQRAGTQKRGGGCLHVPLDFGTAETRYGAEPADPDRPDKLFDRAWALALLERTMARLQAEQGSAGNARLFELLSPRLTDAPDAPSYETVAKDLGVSAESVRMTKSRLSKRFVELLRHEIAQTVDSPAEVEGELRHLITALGT